MTSKRSAYAPPMQVEGGLWPIIYGSQGIVLGYCTTKAEAERTAAALNAQAPQYNHRVGEQT